MEVERISEICIKPSSPTPSHLKTYKISLLDQLVAQFMDIPMILYYPNKGINLSSKMSMLLKQSLSETLTHYYPLAGRIKDSFSIDCNDEGVSYVEAKASISLSEYLTRPDLLSLNCLMPRNNWCVPGANRPYVLMIQETIFGCGGIAIGVVGSHMVMDGTALASFLKCWAAIASNSAKDIIPPGFDGPSIFPQHEAFKKDIILSFYEPLLRTGKLGTRRFVFDASSVANLRAEATTSRVENPTRVEVVSARLLECIAGILKQRSSGFDRPIAFTHAVNLRRRATPPISQTSLGSFVHLAHALCSPEEIKIAEIVYKLREAIRRIDSEFVKKLQSGGYSKVDEMYKEASRDLTLSNNGVNYVNMSSWCNFGLYEVDFGWGKPMWVSGAALESANSETPILNLTVLLDARIDKGIEAWILMDEEELVLLEKHENLLQYASLNPTPLNLYK